MWHFDPSPSLLFVTYYLNGPKCIYMTHLLVFWRFWSKKIIDSLTLNHSWTSANLIKERKLNLEHFLVEPTFLLKNLLYIFRNWHLSLWSGVLNEVLMCINYYYRAFHGFGQAKFSNGGSVLSLSQFSILPQLPQKTMLASKGVKIDSKINKLLQH